MLRAKKIVPIAAMTADTLEIAGVASVPSVKKWLPKLDPTPYYFGIWAPKGIPQEVVDKMNDVWEKNVKNSAALKKWAEGKGQVVFPYYGEKAMDMVWPAIRAAAWGLWNSGQAKVDPAKLGFEKP